MLRTQAISYNTKTFKKKKKKEVDFFVYFSMLNMGIKKSLVTIQVFLRKINGWNILWYFPFFIYFNKC
jgi:hypothetical protein